MSFIALKGLFTVRETAGTAVILSKKKASNSAFTLIEVLTVVILIGILSAMAYSSLMDLIFTNRAKETAQTMRTFAERALAESKRLQKTVDISVVENEIRYTINEEENDDEDVPDPIIISEFLSSGFKAINAEDADDDNAADNAPPIEGLSAYPNQSITSELKIGISNMATPGYFAACGARGYCGAAVKTRENNSFVAYVKKGANAEWGAL